MQLVRELGATLVEPYTAERTLQLTRTFANATIGLHNTSRMHTHTHTCAFFHIHTKHGQHAHMCTYTRTHTRTHTHATPLSRVLGPEPWNVAYPEPSVRPDDSRYGDNPNRVQRHTQFQVILKPDPGGRTHGTKSTAPGGRAKRRWVGAAHAGGNPAGRAGWGGGRARGQLRAGRKCCSLRRVLCRSCVRVTGGRAALARARCGAPPASREAWLRRLSRAVMAPCAPQGTRRSCTWGAWRPWASTRGSMTSGDKLLKTLGIPP
jgi:hypothetical protein